MSEHVADIDVDPGAVRVHEEGWQSWSPTAVYTGGDRPFRPVSERNRLLCYRHDRASPTSGYVGEGLLAVQPEPDGDIHVVSAQNTVDIPSITAKLVNGRLKVSADGPVDYLVDNGGGGLVGALARWADGFAAATASVSVRPAPSVWCSWYHYFTRVTEADMLENLEQIAIAEVPVDVVQLDDGYQTEIGDWLSLSDRFESLPDLVGRIRAEGRGAGIWTAPFLAGERSRVFSEHPEWFIGGVQEPALAGHNWEQNLYALDVTMPAAAEYLRTVFRTLRSWGIDYFKIDFIYAAAIAGRRHGLDVPLKSYREGLRLIRECIGDAYLLGCGAPMLPSVGLVDAMRVSPDTAPLHEPVDGDLSQPASRSAMMTGEARAYMHGRFWINDPDCLIVRPEVQRREEWAEHVEHFGGLLGSSDRIADLDEWGLETTRRLLSEQPPERFIES